VYTIKKLKSGQGPIKGCRDIIIIIIIVPFLVFRRIVASRNGGCGTALRMYGVYVNSLETVHTY
jgi:hypothetical protein